MVDLRSSGRSSVVPVVIDTALGTIAVDLYTGAAPVTCANFLQHADAGEYDGGRFHRVVREDNQPNDDVRIAVVQGGEGTEERMAGEMIALERTSVTGLQHHDGTISMARMAPDTAISDFFICVGDQPDLDYGGARNPDGQGFAAFGEVTDGMDVVLAIHRAPADGQALTPPIPIISVHRVD